MKMLQRFALSAPSLDLRARLVWSLLTVLGLLPPLIFTTDYYWGCGLDLPLHFHPVREAGYNALKAGEFPLWYPFCASGLPYQTGFRTLLYPIHLLGLLVSTGLAVKLSLICHIYLAAFFTLTFMNWLGFCGYASVLAAISFSGSGFMMAKTYAGHIDSVEVIAYMPLVFWCFSLAFRYRGVGWTILCGLAVALMGLAGNYEMIYYCVLGACALQLSVCLAGARAKCPSLTWGDAWARQPSYRTAGAPNWTLQSDGVPWKSRLEDVVASGGRIVLVGAVSMGTLLFRLLPSVQSALYSNRLSDPSTFSADLPPPMSFLTYLVPHFFEGTNTILCWSRWPSWEQQGYVGIVLLCLAPVALLRIRADWLAPACLSVFFLLLSLGPQAGLYRIWRVVDPFATYFRTPGRYSLLTTFFLIWLGALAVQHLWEGKTPTGRLLAQSCPTALLLLCGLIWLLAKQSDPAGWALFARPFVSPQSWKYLLEQHPDNLEGLLHTNLVRTGISFALAGGALLFLTVSRKLSLSLLTLLALLDLSIFAAPYLRTAPPSAFELPGVVKDAVKHLEPGARVLWDTSFQWYNRFAPLGVSDVAAYDQFLDRPYVRAMNLQNGIPVGTPATLTRQKEGGPLWDYQGAALVISPYPLQKPGLELMTAGEGCFIYRNQRARPRAFLLQSDPAPTVETFMEELAKDPAAFPWEPVERLKLGLNEVEIVARAKSPRILVLTDAPWPGWWVEVDGRREPMLGLNGGLHRGVRLGSGRHVVTFKYWPKTLTYGLLGSLLTFLLALGISRPWRYQTSRL